MKINAFDVMLVYNKAVTTTSAAATAAVVAIVDIGCFRMVSNSYAYKNELKMTFC